MNLDQVLIAALSHFTSDAVAALRVLKAQYEYPKRWYHTFDHVHRMLDDAIHLGWSLNTAEIVAIAYHDSVYVVGNGSNEMMSVAFMDTQLGVFQEDNELSLVDQIILDTAQYLEPEKAQPDSHRVMDLDLLSLACDEFVMWKQDRTNLHREFGIHWGDDSDFLRCLLARDKLFLTPGLEAHEERARRYITRYIEGKYPHATS